MSFNVNPIAWKGIILSAAGKVVDKTLQDWQRQVSDFCTQVQSFLTPAGIASILQHANVTTINGTTNCANASVITANLAITGTSTMTLNNVPDAAAFDLRVTNGSGSGQLLKIAINAPAGSAYTVLVLNAGFATTEINMTSTGFTVPNVASIYLRGIAQGSTGFVLLGYV